LAYDYKGKLVLITGVSSGLGWHLAHTYHTAGAELALIARRRERLHELVTHLDPEGKRARYFCADLLDTERIPALADEVVETFGKPIDVVVHSAGMSCYGEVERSPFEIITQITTLNYLAGIRLVQCVLEPMKRRRGGQIIWIGSGSSFRGIPRAAAYSASKAAVKSFCEALRSEVCSFGVDVLLVIPGALKTGFHEQQPNFSSDQRLRSIGAPSDPEALARSILKAGKRQQSILVYGRYAWIGQHMTYWSPWLLDRLLRWQL